ncbi:flagellar protein FlaG [Shewanella sp. N2AIL]|uniref:flagellar protein FlaG n=1 Tax=Shewanella sp. N2AIL TaxID=2926851 RepID=UPI001F565205|nr:flagellar protein FlaG [Shewanella sp. N2AIL]MCI2962192.1 flagellar protein FlaG [Shewanella sp. N2AIL]
MDINLVSSPPMAHAKADVGQTLGSITAKDVELKRNEQAQTQTQANTITPSPDSEGVNQEPDAEKLNEVATELTDMMSMMRKGLAFKVDDQSGRPIVTVLDRDTGDIIRQMPTEEALALAEKLSEVTGLLMKTEA